MPRILIIAVSLGLVMIFVMLFLWPKYQNFTNLQIQLKNKEAELRNQNEYYKDLFSLSEKLKEFETEISNIDSALPSDVSAAALSFHNYLPKAASENGVILKNMGSFSISTLSGKENIQVISIPIEVSGSYSSLKNFLTALEKSARIIEVTSISFSSPQEEEFFGFQLNVQTHSY